MLTQILPVNFCVESFNCFGHWGIPLLLFHPQSCDIEIDALVGSESPVVDVLALIHAEEGTTWICQTKSNPTSKSKFKTMFQKFDRIFKAVLN